jgi:hypothetical protein
MYTKPYSVSKCEKGFIFQNVRLTLSAYFDMLLNCHWIPFFLRIWNKTKTVFWFCSYEVVDLEQWIYMFLFLQMSIELQYKTAIIKSPFRIFLDNKCEWPDTQGIYFKSVVVDSAVVVRYWESYPILSFYATLPSI